MKWLGRKGWRFCKFNGGWLTWSWGLLSLIATTRHCYCFIMIPSPLQSHWEWQGSSEDGTQKSKRLEGGRWSGLLLSLVCMLKTLETREVTWLVHRQHVKRESSYILVFSFSFFWLKFFRQWVYGGANWFHFLLNNCCWKLLFRHRHRHRHLMLILLWNKDEGRHEEVEEEKAVPKQGKKKLRKEKEIVKFRKVTLWVCSSKDASPEKRC